MKVRLVMHMENEHGALDRVVSVLSRRRVPIDSLVMEPSGEEGVARVTIRVRVDSDHAAQQLVHQIAKGISVLEVGVSSAEVARDPPSPVAPQGSESLRHAQ